MKKNAFTLMEVVVVMAVLIVLGGILLPQVNRVIKEAKISRAKAELEHIKSALLSYKEDTGELPPKESVSASEVNVSTIMAALLATDSASGWNGPYIEKTISTDPWGNNYKYADYDGSTGKPISYLLSYGPDGGNDMTNPHLTSASNGDDDIYVVVYNDGD